MDALIVTLWFNELLSVVAWRVVGVYHGHRQLIREKPDVQGNR